MSHRITRKVEPGGTFCFCNLRYSHPRLVEYVGRRVGIETAGVESFCIVYDLDSMNTIGRAFEVHRAEYLEPGELPSAEYYRKLKAGVFRPGPDSTR